ncbi:hypothetical protein N0V93_002378 [Gnomoniopsis smithogilvyi]|uniref:Uncharacterized protein n=1 Tax=Gnomoniopsis smithogilvyi TaxID=1191159 RepID=A0A9W8YWF0_9PEZI|nr:hypothetical protein N0V93_002378 [Gnomoniopsis smithogilvyi]
MSGLATFAAGILQRFRTDEIQAGIGYRIILLFSICNAFIPEFISPLATFVVVGRQLSLSEVFGTLSYLTLLSAPLSQLFQRVPMIMACIGSLKRVQEFLDKDKDEDYRVFEQPMTSNAEGIIKFHEEQPRVGYCDQKAFLLNGSIRSNIVGFEPFEGILYEEILEVVMFKSDLRTLPMADETQVGSGGVTLSGGQKQRVALARALYLRTDLYVLDDFTIGLDKITADEIVRRLFGEGGFLARRKATVVWCTHSVQYLHMAKQIIALSADGAILHQGGPDEVLKDREVTMALEHDGKPNGHGDIGSELKMSDVSTPKPPTTDKSASRALTEASVYTHYFSSFGPSLIIGSILAAIAVGFFPNAGSVWLKFWADNSFAIPGPISRINAFYIGIYAVIQIAALAALVGHVALVIIGMAKASGTALHLRAVQALMLAPLRFVTKTDQGIIVNYFSQDMNMIDMTLPAMLMNTSALALLSLGQSIVIALGTPFILCAYPVLIIVLLRLTKYYLATSRQLRLLELENKSPLYTQFADTVRGIVSIRAFGWISAYKAQNHRLMDDSLRPLYLLEMLGIWLSLVLKLMVAVIAVTVTVLVTQIPSLGDRAGFVAAGFLALMRFGGMLNSVVQCWVQLETSLGAVKRLKEFGETAGSEDRVGEDLRPDEQWPKRGEIVIDGVDASYAETRFKDIPEEMDLALKGLSLKVSAGEKVAIVGRTGSGKSSLLLLLLRLLDPSSETEDNLSIDGLPLRRLNRDALRQRIIAMPQDMIFLAAGETFKAALDPYARASDEELLVALEEVGLLKTVQDAGGLDACVAKDTLSQGQKQLFSLAVAVLRARVREQAGAVGGVLLLDEVTSNVDRETEKTIMGVIDRIFREYSVLAVTHSLKSVVSFDRVVVMAEGCVVKEGTPMSLISDGEHTG